MPLNDLIIAKINQGFDYLDADGDGKLDENDHVLMGQRSAKALGHPSGSDAEQRIIDSYLKIWRDVHLPQVPAGANAISREQFVTSTSGLADDPATAQATLGEIAASFLAIADVDHDGRISPEEFLTFQRGHFPGLTDAEGKVAFGHLDLNGDGYLSPEEFTRATVEYWTSSDPDAPGNWWMGRLPETGG